MNPLTQVKNTQKITARETASGISERGSWHEKYKDSAYINVGLLPFDLTEGDLLGVFAQYGEVVDVNLVRDKATGKSRGFAFLAYEDQRSTVLAVDNLNGASLLGRTIRVDHVANYKKKQEEDAEEEQRKREERGVCYAFQRGECNRGDACKFSHNLQRHENTGWGKKDDGGPLAWNPRNKGRRSPSPPPSRMGADISKRSLPSLRHHERQGGSPELPGIRNGSKSAPKSWNEDRRMGNDRFGERGKDRDMDDGPSLGRKRSHGGSGERTGSRQYESRPVKKELVGVKLL